MCVCLFFRCPFTRLLLLQALQEAFQAQDTDALKAALAAMSVEEAQHHIKRCTDSGLWVPG